MVRNSNETLSRYIDSLLTKPRLRKGTRGELQDREATKEQLDVLRRYYKYLKFEKKVKITTISSYLSTIRFFIVETGKRFEDITKEDIQNYFEHTDSNSEYTKQRVRNALKQFFKWLYNTPKDEYPDVVDWITVGKFRKYLSPDDLLTEDEVLRILNACDNPRDRALISLLFDSAMRVTEVSNLDLKDLKVNDNHAIVFIRQAKTSSGTREVPIVNAVPALKNWLSHHPYK
ncbi:MAG: tyrosine-type recombinase/integrase, partial [Candidatus Aenigmatarchaeota archaeon]